MALFKVVLNIGATGNFEAETKEEATQLAQSDIDKAASEYPEQDKPTIVSVEQILEEDANGE